MRNFQYIVSLCISILLFMACSTTKNLPEGEQLYVGQKAMILNNTPTSSVGETALTEIEAALATAPNNAFMGSSTMKIPFPIGLWVYNGFEKYQDKKGIGRWIFDRFATDPVLLSQVNPAIRKKAGENILREFGYFNGDVSYQTFTDKKDPKKVQLQYTVDFRNPYIIDTVFFQGFNERTMRIMERSRRRSLISPGEQFNVLDLNEERTRISNLLRNVGYYYFRPDYLTYQADTTLVRGGHVALRMVPVAGMPPVAEKPFFLDNDVHFYLLGDNGEMPTDSMRYENLHIYYHDKLKVRPRMLYRWVNYKGYRLKRQVADSTGIERQRRAEGLYSVYRQERVQERLANIGIFRYTEMRYEPRDTAFVSDTLNYSIWATLDKPYDAELDLNFKTKSNNQMGPGASFSVTKKNVFGGGESWGVEVKGSYEWQTGKNSSSKMNSYEWGLSSSLTFPRILFPGLSEREYDFAAATRLKLYIDQLNRAKYYKLLAFGGGMSYEFQPTNTLKHNFTPFRLTFNVLRDPTPEFEAIQAENPALYISLRNQFIPMMEYTLTYDNSSLRTVRNPIWWQTTVASAGNVTLAIYTAFGKPFNERNKELLGVPFAQFLKLNSEFRYHWRMDRNNSVATRFAAGVIWAYGNATTAPYTEQFYIGGANSVRAFSARSLGPGSYYAGDGSYNFINHVGDVRLEANLEYRFRILGDLHGATFLDAGNVWLLRKDEGRPGGELTAKHFIDQIALGTGVGVRYDMDFLVFRLDLGVGLHYPYENGRSGYFNMPKFKDNLALHFAIGYPF